ncbi:phosphoenolpyruvate synthase [Patescibacteria group bacterium]|nr:phosphoenolpyruvate synthase [Patescibacteria group bacterium]
MPEQYVLWFKEVGKDDVGRVGGKGANLGEMTRAQFPVPPGFIVSVAAYNHFLDVSGLRTFIHDELKNLDVSDSAALEKSSRAIRERIVRTAFPREIAKPVLDAYFSLDRGMLRHATVAVRSSATAEDLPGASFAGQQDTYLNVYGEANLIEKIKEAWASLFTGRAIFYRATNHYDHFKVGIAIPVQKMVESDMSGIMFTIDPVTNDKKKIIIEAIFGLGEMIVQGAVTPDHYEVDKQSLTVTGVVVRTQEKMMRQKDGKTGIVPLSKEDGGRRKLTDDQVLALARLGKKLEEHYYFPQDSEWAIERGEVFLVQTRPVTTVGKKHEAETGSPFAGHEVIVKGDPASPGIASGPVKVLSSPSEIGKIVSGDVLVAEMTNPDYVPAMKKAVAIITERGGRTSHAAIVSRELGIPAVVGAEGILKNVKDGLVVSVDGTTGSIYKGAVSHGAAMKAAPRHAAEHIKTATKVYVNMAEPDRAAKNAALNVDGVGLLRAEFMIAQIGTHPRKFIADKKEDVFVRALASGLEQIANAFRPRPVIYRATDFRTNEYRDLKGGDAYEPKEDNPMLGFRGAARYIADASVFNLELEALKYVRNKIGLKNLNLMIPFVRSPGELLEVKKLVTASGLARSAQFKLSMMVEIPTNVIRIEEFLDVGIDGISIGSNDLTMLILGTDRDNSEVRGDYDERDPAVLWALEHVIRAAAKRGVTSSICGQAPSDYPELVEKLVSWGITGVSVNPDAVDQVRETIAHAEAALVTGKSTPAL